MQYTFKVYPKGRGRECYRVIRISGKETLDTLCEAVIEAFDFDGGHMYEFCMNNRMYDAGNYQSDGDGKFQRSTKEKIDRIQLVEGQKFSLHYDFGDDWMFVINVQRIEKAEGKTTPCVIQGKGSVVQYPDWDEFE